MELKSGDNDYYAIYKEYKQKYLDLKNNILGGGKVRTQSDLHENFLKLKPDSKNNKNNREITIHNNLISQSILIDQLKKNLTLVPKYTTDNHTKVKNMLIKEQVFVFFKKIDDINDLLNTVRPLLKNTNANIEKIKSIMNDIENIIKNDIKINHKPIINKNNYDLIFRFDFDINKTNYDEIIIQIEKILTTQSTTTTTTTTTTQAQDKKGTTNVPQPPPPPQPTTKKTKTDVSQPQPQPVKECTDKKIKNFKIDNNISQCKFTDKEKLNNIYTKQFNFLNSIKDIECKSEANKKLKELDNERYKCENKILDNKQVLDAIIKKKPEKKEEREQINTIQNKNDDFDASDQYNQITQTTENEASDKKVKQTGLVADKFTNVQKKTDSVNTKLRNVVSKTRDKIVQKNAYEADLRNAQASFSDSDLYYTELNQQQQQQQTKQQQQQEQQEQQKEEEYDNYTRKRQDIDNDTDSDNNVQTYSLSGIKTPSSTQYFDQKNYLIKVGDKFLIFDINESQMAKIKDIQTNCNKIINSSDLKEFYHNFSTFHQLKEDDEIKRGKLIINKQSFQGLLNDNKITNAYIITILKNNNQSFVIDVFDLKNKSVILEFNQNIADIENKINNIKDCNIPDEDFNKININGNSKESESMAKSFDTLKIVINDYKLKIKDIRDDDNKKLQAVKNELIDKLNQIKTSNKITTQHEIVAELNVNKEYSGDGGQSVKVGNVELLKLIKTKMGMGSDVLDRSVILKLQTTQIAKEEKDHNYYKFGEYINKYTPYSAYNNAYILLGLVISHQRYNNLKKHNQKS